MTRATITLILFLFSTVGVFSQIRATTESGNKVLLLDDGTWKYEEQNVNESVAATTAAVATVAVISIDSTKSETSEPEEIYYGQSARLVKYFGDDGGNIRCKISCSNDLGKVTFQFVWEFPVSDGNRYYGWFEDKKVTFTMEEGEEIVLTSGEKSEIKRYERNNYSVLTNMSLPLTSAQIQLLSTQPIRKISVEWKKKVEEYDVTDRRVIMDNLAIIL